LNNKRIIIKGSSFICQPSNRLGRGVQRSSLFLLLLLLGFTGCKRFPYTFKDVSIPQEVKTVKVGYFDNRARYVNPQLSPKLTEKVRDKIVRQTRLTQTNSEEAHYMISGTINEYSITTSGVNGQQASSNRLNVSVHIVLKKNLDQKTEEYDVTRTFDFPASLSLQQAEAQLLDEMIRNLADEIFNKIFSNW
jgi:Lipopolysaccharide-assembly